MNRFKKILVVCTQGSQSKLAIERAITLAKETSAKIVLIDVIDIDRMELANIFKHSDARMVSDLQHQVFEHHLNELKTLEGILKKQGLNVSSVVLNGLPFVEIIRAVLRDGFDIVIKGTNSRKTIGKSGFGPLDMHLMRKCPCPVWVIQDRPKGTEARLAAAVDPDRDDPEREQITKLIMDLSTSLCAAEKGRLHVVHAWKLQEEEALLNSPILGANPYEVEKMRKNKRALRAKDLKQLMSSYPDPTGKYKTHLLRGEAGEIVPNFARRSKIDIVVMGTVDRTSTSGLFIGNTAEMILGRVACSVFAVKPVNFKSPIELNPVQ